MNVLVTVNVRNIMNEVRGKVVHDGRMTLDQQLENLNFVAKLEVIEKNFGATPVAIDVLTNKWIFFDELGLDSLEFDSFNSAINGLLDYARAMEKEEKPPF